MNYYRPSFCKRLYTGKNQYSREILNNHIINQENNKICSGCKQEIIADKNSKIDKTSDASEKADQDLKIKLPTKISYYTKISQHQIKKLFQS